LITKTNDIQDFLIICDELNKVKNCRINSNKLTMHMSCNPNVSTYVSHDNNNKLNGCVVLLKTMDILGDLIFFVLFQWRDSHFPKLAQEFIEFASERAKEEGISKIVFTNSRDEKVVERASGKYGFRKAYSVWEKEVII